MEMFRSPVIVTANADGKIVVHNEEGPYGYIRVQQMISYQDAGGFLKTRTVSALVPGKIVDLEKIVEMRKLTDGSSFGGKICMIESVTPFKTRNPEKDLKYAGNTRVVCKQGGKSIYRITKWFSDPNAADELIPHDNKEEIQKAILNSPLA